LELLNDPYQTEENKRVAKELLVNFIKRKTEIDIKSDTENLIYGIMEIIIKNKKDIEKAGPKEQAEITADSIVNYKQDNQNLINTIEHYLKGNY
jgi:uncharacterized protein YecA (UPF0149 family)